MAEIVIIGYPSRYGGADTELDHQIHVWQALGWRVHVIHTGIIDDNLRALRLAEDRECLVHSSMDWSQVRGRVVISYCNGQFLSALPHIREHEPKAVLWVNCMRWLFPAEKEAHRAGLIDWFLYQTESVRVEVEPVLREINPSLRQAVVDPYFHSDGFDYREDKPGDRFRFCRISREDLGKFHTSQLWVYETMVAPVLKEGTILGVNEAVRMKLASGGASIPDWIRTLPAGGEPVRDIYARSHALIQMADPSLTENLPRVGFEAMATGTALCVDRRGGWMEQVVHGETGFLCSDQRDFVYYASRLAYEPEERRRLVANARDHLASRWSFEASKRSWAAFFDEADLW
jgi:hypothetical protein